MSDRSGPAEGVKGVVEDVKGRFKEAVGAVTANDSKVREGQAQQDKAAAQREVADKEAAADRARTEADVHEARERSHQDR
ncbi:CsbD family protein [Actinophytocola sp.]|uniref:microaggregate-binding protein 1 n=1 Tax=Actinophytocola sp. TaxID=1872138 RepID=UPI00389B3737